MAFLYYSKQTPEGVIQIDDTSVLRKLYRRPRSKNTCRDGCCHYPVSSVVSGSPSKWEWNLPRLIHHPCTFLDNVSNWPWRDSGWVAYATDNILNRQHPEHQKRYERKDIENLHPFWSLLGPQEPPHIQDLVNPPSLPPRIRCGSSNSFPVRLGQCSADCSIHVDGNTCRLVRSPGLCRKGSRAGHGGMLGCIQFWDMWEFRCTVVAAGFDT